MKIDGVSWHNNENRWRYKMSGVWVSVEARVTVGNIIEKKGRRFTVNRSIDGWRDVWMDGCMDGWMYGWMDGWMIQYCAALYCIVFYYT